MQKSIPAFLAQGSVGASGDLAPLAHLSAVLLGVRSSPIIKGNIISAEEALQNVQLEPLTLAPKEGLALLNGTQVSTALALLGLFAAENIFIAAIIAGALSVMPARGSVQPFDERIQLVRGHASTNFCSKMFVNYYRRVEFVNLIVIVKKYKILIHYAANRKLWGLVLRIYNLAAETLLIEANAVSDNPLIFADAK